MARRYRNGMALMTASALALAAAGQAQAVEFTAGDTKVDVYGYARLNMSYDADEDIAATTQAGSFSAVNTGDAEDDEISNHFGADAQQSRLGVTVNHDSGAMVKVEGDFRGGTLRLRHAYGEWNGILAGQAWSNYNSFVGYTSTLDFDSLAGLAGYQDRTAQLRYTVGDFSVSVEKPEVGFSGSFGDVAGGNDTSSNDGKTSIPAFTARYESSAGPVAYSFAGLIKRVEVDDGASLDDGTTGTAGFAAVTFNATDALSFQGVINVADGANAYVYRSGESFAAVDAYVDDGNLETISTYGYTLGMSYATGIGSFNVGYGEAGTDYDDAEADLGASAVADRDETHTNVFVNYQWTPVTNVMYGLEYQHFQVEEVDGDDGDANRLLFAAQYSF